MDVAEYMPMFLAEAREHLQQLNLAIVGLEEDPSDRATVDGIFRIAHSLKGMSATMGFVAIAELTHAMEDVFELLRQRTTGLEEEAITALLACLDALDGAVDSIERDGEERLDPTPLVIRLRGLIRDRTPEQQLAVAGGATIPSRELLAAVRADGERILHARVQLDPQTQMPAVRAHMVLSAMADNGELIGSIPAPETLEHFDGRTIEAWVVTEQAETALCAAAERISEVTRSDVQELATAAADAAPAAAAATPRSEPSGAVPETNPATKARPSGRTVRVDAQRLDMLLHLMGELVIHRTAVETASDPTQSPELQQALQNLARSSQALQSMVMQVRMIPIEVVFMRIPRLVRDLATKLGKQVELELLGTDTELDRTVVDAIGDPLVHLVRNAVDHGLESAERREAAGKPATGRLTIAARHAGGSVVIEVSDDGRGIDHEQIVARAIERGLLERSATSTLSERDVVELLFQPGFSTAEATSSVSGRGVGLDAVRDEIRQLGGEVIFGPGATGGTRAEIRLPLTLAIVSSLQVDVAGDPFALPIERVQRALRLSDHPVHAVVDRHVITLEDGVVPLLDGRAAFGLPAGERPELAVIVRAGDRRVGLLVDRIVGQRELVTRPVPAVAIQGLPVSGGAVLADGDVALIVDCDALADHASATVPLAA